MKNNLPINVFFVIIYLTIAPLATHAAEVLESSVHEGFGCKVCHKTSKGGGPANCAKCHEDQAGIYRHSVHATKNTKGETNASCSDCHGSHHILPVSNIDSLVSTVNIVNTCGKCHSLEKNSYLESIHSEIHEDDPDSAPACQDCHGSHDISSAKTPEFVKKDTHYCGSCHKQAMESYEESLHGQIVALEGGLAATCWDCHDSHKIIETTASASPVSKDRQMQTCSKCHGKVSPFFVSYWSHADVHNKKEYPLLYYAYIMMKILFVVVMVTATIHTLAWVRGFPRLIKARIEKPKGRHYVYYLRFPLWHRLTHLILFISVLGLSLSGLTLRYSNADWAIKIVELMGGFKNVDILHKCMAALLFLAVLLHVYFLVSLIREKGVKGFIRFLSSPDSLFPKIQDFKEAWAEFLCFLKGTPEPERDRWSYWEKFDYWAVFWGMIVIGGSGLMLAFPEFVTKLMPGWVLNIALIFHSEEALLAIFFLFIFHFFHSHLRPMKFPIDESIFTGRISEEDYFNERPIEVARKTAEELEKMRAKPPNFYYRLAVYIISFIAVDLGLFLIICILYTAWQTGKFLP